MKKTMKSILALALLAATLATLLLFVSCGTDEDIKSFLTAEEYTIENELLTIKVDGDKVYYKSGNVEKYLYLIREETMYYYCEIVDGKIVTKRAIDSEHYIVYRESMVSYAMQLSQVLTATLQMADKTKAEDGSFVVNGYTISSLDGNITIAKDGQTTVISGINKTKLEIPESVLAKKAVKG